MKSETLLLVVTW